MTDRYNALIVSLERDIREDDAEAVINAIKMIKGVNGVTANSVDPDSYAASTRVRQEVSEKLYSVIQELNGFKK